MIYPFLIVFAVLLACIIFLDKKYGMLRDISNASQHKPYSWSRVQMAWWTLIIPSSFISIFLIYKQAPLLDQSGIILLGMSAATTATARIIDNNDIEQYRRTRHQNLFGKNFILDILSDQTGVSVHRFQTLVFNASFGVYFISEVMNKLLERVEDINNIMPIIPNTSLALLGISSATYAALKITENKTASLTIMNESSSLDDEMMEEDGSVG
jgi:hypothetical protein